jgi:hypothetical protein
MMVDWALLAGMSSRGSALTMRTLPSASVISSSEILESDTRSISVLSFLRSIKGSVRWSWVGEKNKRSKHALGAKSLTTLKTSFTAG